MQDNVLQFKTIALATDLSEATSPALQYAQSIACVHHATLVLIHVIDPVAYAFPEGMPDFLAADQAARQELKRIEDDARAQGIPVHSVLETGLVCERILQSLNDHSADLLILGTQGQTGAGRAALGAVARQLLAKAPCPIMTVPPRAAMSLPWSARSRRVLAATDFSASSIAALQYAHQLALRQFVVLHVHENEDGKNSPLHLERLRLLAPFNESHTVPVEHIVATGNPGEKIVAYAGITSADLIVLGAPVDELGPDDFAASTVLEVISQAACPVLCIPEPWRTQSVTADLDAETAALA